MRIDIRRLTGHYTPTIDLWRMLANNERHSTRAGSTYLIADREAEGILNVEDEGKQQELRVFRLKALIQLGVFDARL